MIPDAEKLKPGEVLHPHEKIKLDTVEMTSPDLVKVVKYVLGGKTKSVKSLRGSVIVRIYQVLDAIEGDEGMMEMVFDFHQKGHLKWGQVRKMKSFLANKCGKVPQIDAVEEEEYGNKSLYELGIKIREIYSGTWFSDEYIAEFVEKGVAFASEFLFYYGESDESGECNVGGVRTKTKSPNHGKNRGDYFSNEDAWVDDEDERWYGFLHTGDIVTLRILFSAIQSFLASVKRHYRDSGGEDTQKNPNILARRTKLQPLVSDLKKVTYMFHVRRALETENEYNLIADMITIMEKWDSYSMEFNT